MSLSVTPGKIYGIIGRNGSGKTVLFKKSICGFVLPDAGKILVRGKQVGKDVDIPQGIGIIIEHPGFLRDYSGFQNLKLLARLQKKITDEKIKRASGSWGLIRKIRRRWGNFPSACVSDLEFLILPTGNYGKSPRTSTGYRNSL